MKKKLSDIVEKMNEEFIDDTERQMPTVTYMGGSCQYGVPSLGSPNPDMDCREKAVARIDWPEGGGSMFLCWEHLETVILSETRDCGDVLETKSVLDSLAESQNVVLATTIAFDSLEETYAELKAERDSLLNFAKDVIAGCESYMIGLKSIDEIAPGDSPIWTLPDLARMAIGGFVPYGEKQEGFNEQPQD